MTLFELEIYFIKLYIIVVSNCQTYVSLSPNLVPVPCQNPAQGTIMLSQISMVPVHPFIHLFGSSIDTETETSR